MKVIWRAPFHWKPRRYPWNTQLSMNRTSELINEGMKNPIKESRMNLEDMTGMWFLYKKAITINSINISEGRMYPQKEGRLPWVQKNGTLLNLVVFIQLCHRERGDVSLVVNIEKCTRIVSFTSVDFVYLLCVIVCNRYYGLVCACTCSLSHTHTHTHTVPNMEEPEIITKRPTCKHLLTAKHYSSGMWMKHRGDTLPLSQV